VPLESADKGIRRVEKKREKRHRRDQKKYRCERRSRENHSDDERE
jgi:hypothetical protein